MIVQNQGLAACARRVRSGLALVLGSGLLCLAIGVPLSGWNQPAGAAESPVAGLRVVNWYPADRGWTYLWTNWDASVVSADFARIASLHANGVRIVVFPGVFGYPTPTPDMVQRLAATVQLADSYGLRVQLTLFDWFSSWNHVAGSQQWASAVLAPFAGDPRIAFVEVRNEIDPYDPAAMAWARAMVPFVQTRMPATPVTVSTSGEHGLAGLSALKAALAPAPPSFYNFHYYGDPALVRSVLGQAKAAVAPTTLYVGEFGFSTVAANTIVSGLAAGTASLEAWQDYNLRAVQLAASELGLAAASPWTAYDFAPGAIPPEAAAGPLEYGFGLFRVNGTAKPSAASQSAIFAGQPADPGWNESFESSVSGPDGVQPALWRRFQPTATYGWRDTVAHSGTGSVAISQSGSDAAGAPAYFLTPVAPAIVANQVYRASVWARGDTATGETRLAVAWFDASFHYLGQAETSTLPAGTTSWTKLSLKAKAPAGAVTAEVHLKSSNNQGTAHFDDVSFS